MINAADTAVTVAIAKTPAVVPPVFAVSELSCQLVNKRNCN